MYERYSDRGRKVMQLANQEAQRFNHEYIGTEHILLGLLRADDSTAAHMLQNLDVDSQRVRIEVERIIQSGPDMVTMGKLPQTPRAKKVIEYSIEEARNLNHNYVGTEHLLLGLLREQEGVAAQVLMNLGLKLEDVREEVEYLLGMSSAGAVRPRPESTGPEERSRDLPLDTRQAVQELDARIEQLNEEKITAIAANDFERAAHLRDQADRHKKARTAILRNWPRRFVIDPGWLSWNGSAVTRIAGLIHEERRWQELPVLADALEEAGCADQEILGHCREAAGHTRRCWVVDLLLNRV